MADSGLVDIPAGQSILPALAQKEYELEQKIRQAEAEVKSRIEEVREEAQERLRKEEAAIEQEEQRFVEQKLAEARTRAEKVEKDGAAQVADLRSRAAERIERAADVVVKLVLGQSVG